VESGDRIKPTNESIRVYLENLKNKQYQIPTFQRDVVWEKDNVKRLWDSIYKFYPIGSILIWKTDTQLHKHREIGGHPLELKFPVPEYRYILDGQQRTVSLLTSIFGGKIKGKDDFDPTLYIDLTVSPDQEDEDDSIYRERFLFWDEIDSRGGKLKRNIPRKKKLDQGLIVKLRDIKDRLDDIEKNIYDMGYVEWDNPYRQNLRVMRNVLDNYQISFIELRGIQVNEVCEIFERINQEGKPLDIFDIVVAKTYRPKDDQNGSFYFREKIEKFRDKTPGYFAVELEDRTFLELIAVLILNSIEDSGVYNITETYLSRIKAEQIEEVWEDAEKAFLRTFDFFENHLNLKGPRLIPLRYLYMSTAYYFFRNSSPDYEFLKKYFWFVSFNSEDVLRNTTHLRNHLNYIKDSGKGKDFFLGQFLINKNSLRKTSYSSRGRYSRAILALLANQDPKDWKHQDKSILSDTYYLLTDKPNLHHIFPMGFVKEEEKEKANSLMNIAFIPQITNLEISNKNPIEYIQDYDNGNLEKVFEKHLVPVEIIEWAKNQKMQEDALEIFIEKRIDEVIRELRNKLEGIHFQIIDTGGEE